MKSTMRQSLLAATAAAALVAGVGVAAAQTGGGAGGGTGTSTGAGGGGTMERQGGSSSRDVGGSAGKAESSGATQSHPNTQNKATESEKPGLARGEETHERGKDMGENKGNKQFGTKDRNDRRLGDRDRDRDHKVGDKDTEGKERLGRGDRDRSFDRGERDERLGRRDRDRGREITSEQRERIHGVFTRDRDQFDRYRVGHVDFDIHPGVRIPRSFHLYTLPSEIVTVVPAYRSYRFFYYEDELVIVDPRTMEIIAVIPG